MKDSVQLWVVPEGDQWRLMRGEHRGIRYVETPGGRTYTTDQAVDMLTRYKAANKVQR